MANKKNSSALSKSIFTIGHHQAPKSQKKKGFSMRHCTILWPGPSQWVSPCGWTVSKKQAKILEIVVN